MTTVWTDERKKEWFKSHPCLKKDGNPGQPHKEGRCKNCGGCLKARCKKPPWCDDHRRSENSRRRPPPQLGLPKYESPTKKLRRRPPQPATITPTTFKGYEGYSDYSAQRMKEHDEEADKERKEGNKLGNLFRDDLNDLSDIPKRNSKERRSKFLKIVKQMLYHLADGDEEEYRTLCNHIVEGLDPSTKSFAKPKSCH